MELLALPGYVNHHELRSIGAVTAHARGHRGQGMTVGILDTTVLPNQPGLAGPNKLRTVGHPEAFGGFPHGTVVANVAAASSSEGGASGNYVGVAPAARVYAYGIVLGSGGGTYRPIVLSPDGLTAFDKDSEREMGDVIRNADVVNFSFGLNGVVVNYDEQSIRASFPRTIRTLAQAGQADKTAIVFAAGNAGNARLTDGTPADASSPEILAGLPFRVTELRGHFLAVVATAPNEDGEERIASYSNRCGVAQTFCLAAPGNVNDMNVLTATSSTRDIRARGTSFAAPRVSGALAVLGSMTLNEDGERTVTMQELIARLLATADKSGEYARRNIYGEGFLDLERATQPVGNLRVAAGLTLDGPHALLEATGLKVGAAFGDAFERAFAERSLTVFDALDFPFRTRLSRTLGPRRIPGWRAFEDFGLWNGSSRRPEAQGVPHLLAGAERIGGWFDGSGTFGLPRSRMAAGHLGLLERAAGLGLAWGDETGAPEALAVRQLRLGLFAERAYIGPHADDPVNGPADGFAGSDGWGAAMQWRSARRPGSWSAIAGLLRQDGRFLGTRASGALASGRAHTVFAGLAGEHALGERWSVLHTAELGMTWLAPPAASLLSEATPLLSSEAAVSLVRHSAWRPGDRLALRLTQPLRIERGQARFRHTAARRSDRRLETSGFEAELTPSGRALELGLDYRLPVGGQMHWSASLGVTRHPGHRRGPTDVGAWTALRWRL